MAISLYTSRIILKNLGVEDYGIYNVVGGFGIMFGFLNTAMSATTQRYITFYLGKGDENVLKKVFSNCLLTHLLIGTIVVIFAESVGLWFLYNKMVIPSDRITAAFWVFQCSVFSIIILILSVPYNAVIIAHERMSAFAYISIYEVIAKLIVAVVLTIGFIDKLVLYAVLLLIVQCSVRYIYSRYCLKHFNETNFTFLWDSKLFKELISFAGWNLWGGISNILYTQGINILLNIYFGPAVNAARGIAVQVQSAVSQFAHSFQMAINPQITKTYAQNDLPQMHLLIYRGSKFTFMLLLIITLPIFIETEYILSMWLKDVPDWTVSFVRLMISIIIIDAVANPFMVSSAATGNVKLYQSVIGGTMLLIVPTAYLFLSNGCPPTTVFFVHIVFCIITFILRLYIVRLMIKFKIKDYLIVSFIPMTKVAVASYAVMAFICRNELMPPLFNIVLSIIVAIISCLVFGMSQEERFFIRTKLLYFYKHKLTK